MSFSLENVKKNLFSSLEINQFINKENSDRLTSNFPSSNSVRCIIYFFEKRIVFFPEIFIKLYVNKDLIDAKIFTFIINK